MFDRSAVFVRTRTTLALAAAATAGVVGVAGCGTATETTAVAASESLTTPAGSSSTANVSASTSPLSTPSVVLAQPVSADAATALTQLETLPVKGRAPKTGYDRALFGSAWSDDVGVDGGRNGCDTRNDILRRDLMNITVKPGSSNCTILTGTLTDTFTGKTIEFTRGEGTSNAVQIDHIVALSDAWQKGAQQLDEQTRRDFANDPRNLQAVDGPANGQKGDGDAATWLPPNKSYRCTYVARQVQVKSTYGLWVTQAEKDAIARVLSDCGAAAAPDPEPIPAVPTTTIAPPPPPPAPVPQEPAAAPPPPAPSGGGVYYKNCTAARDV
uniref:HNH endonuclease family protein n=1 Tax=Rhodococcus marinonascens TaxID=38311 RepID=UPI000AFE2E17